MSNFKGWVSLQLSRNEIKASVEFSRDMQLPIETMVNAFIQTDNEVRFGYNSHFGCPKVTIVCTDKSHPNYGYHLSENGADPVICLERLYYAVFVAYAESEWLDFGFLREANFD